MKFPRLPSNRYDILYADPPWDYKGQLQHTKVKSSGGASAHYSTVTLQDLKHLRISGIVKPACNLFMWSSSPHLDQAIDLAKSWGFAYETVAFIWDKVRVNPGYYTMSQVELCLLFLFGAGVRPQFQPPQLVQAKRTKHSEKPAIVRDTIAGMYPSQDKIELFARGQIMNWEAWGNETGS